jgi:hypothetical protein
MEDLGTSEGQMEGQQKGSSRPGVLYRPKNKCIVERRLGIGKPKYPATGASASQAHRRDAGSSAVGLLTAGRSLAEGNQRSRKRSDGFSTSQAMPAPATREPAT